MNSSRIVIIGSANVDRIVRLPRLPARGETVTGGRFMQAFGGKGANQAVAAARAGGAVSCLVSLGRDPEGDAMMTALAEDGIDLAWAVRTSEASTGAALILCDAQGDNSIAVAPGANDLLRPEHVEAAAHVIAAAQIVVMQMEIPPDTTRRALELAVAAKVPVLFNYAPARDGVPLSLAMRWLVVNEVEAAALAGMSVTSPTEAICAAEALRRHGPEGVIVTLGRDGACVADPSGTFHAPAFAVEPVDSTAAGDTFCGALATALVEGIPQIEAVRFAAAAAAITVTRMGAQSSIPRRKEIDDFLRSPPCTIATP